MARPRRGKRRRQRHNWIPDALKTGVVPDTDYPDANPFEVIAMCNPDSRELREAWEQYGPGIMAGWDLPGCRPWAWWIFDAPRMPEGDFPECRQTLSGPGRPLHEALAFYPSQAFGIWAWYGKPDNPPTFETQFDYLKRHGLLLPGEDEPLPEPHPHPPRIESQARWERLQAIVREQRKCRK
jgi:hypothetical protein